MGIERFMRKKNLFVLILMIFAGLITAQACLAQSIDSKEADTGKKELALEAKPILSMGSGDSSGAGSSQLSENLLAKKERLVTDGFGNAVKNMDEKFSLAGVGKNAKHVLVSTPQVQAQAQASKKQKSEVAQPEKKKTWWIFKKETGLNNMKEYSVEEMPGLLKLDDCIKIAIKNNIQLEVADKSMKLAQMRVFEAKRNMLPTATINFDQYSGRIDNLAYNGRKQYIEGQQPIFHGGELYYTMKQAETNLEVTRNDYNRVKNELILQVKKGYYTLAKAKENLNFQQALSKEVDRILDMVNKEYDAGVTSKIEFLNVSSQAGQVKYQLASAEGDFSVADLILKQSMNLDTSKKIEIEPGLEFKKVDIDFEEALHAALVNRPEMKINSLMIDYYNYGKGIARAKSLPKIDLIGNWGLAKEQFASGEDIGGVVAGSAESTDPAKIEQQWYAGIKASVPIWGSTAEYSWTKEQWVPTVSTFQGTEAVTNSFKLHILDHLDTYSDKQLAEVDFAKARQELNKIKQDVTLEVRENCFNYEKALIQLDTATNKVQYQEKDLEFTKLKRGIDEAQDSNVVDSMIKLAQEKFGYVQALTDCHISLASINKAIGIEDYFRDEKET